MRAVERVDGRLEADALVLDHLSRLGCDPSEPRECRHYFYVPAELGARAVMRTLNASDGWDAEAEELQDSTWLVTASTVTGLTDALVRDTRVWLESLAGEHGGEYDGWEAAAD